MAGSAGTTSCSGMAQNKNQNKGRQYTRHASCRFDCVLATPCLFPRTCAHPSNARAANTTTCTKIPMLSEAIHTHEQPVRRRWLENEDCIVRVITCSIRSLMTQDVF